MPEILSGELVLALLAAFATAAIVLALGSRMVSRRVRSELEERSVATADRAVAFLFEGEDLIDATPEAERLLSAAAATVGTDLQKLASLLRHRFPGLDAAVRTLPDTGTSEITASSGPADVLHAEWLDGVMRLAIAPAAEVPHMPDADRQSIAALDAELLLLRDVLRSLPVPTWRQSRNGMVTWANDAYVALVEDYAPPENSGTWPPSTIFPLTPSELVGGTPVRTALRAADGTPERWFECQGQSSHGEALVFALPADDLVRAEEALREFVQTLSKTFAQLPIGLAIFDRARKLALFNPALTDLTTLDVAFLSARPTLYAFLDRLRDKRRMPEQRDYRAWRAKMAALETAAAGGFVQENWTLPTGQTYRVTGRPHPDGAVAFLFEDISAEISLTRRFRQEIDLSQTVLDSFDEAIAVFSSHGILTISNAAYARLWGTDPAVTLAEIGIVEATRQWQAATQPTPVWGDARDFLSDRGERVEWTAPIRMKDGQPVLCRFRPLPGGTTMVGFLTDVGSNGLPSSEEPALVGSKSQTAHPVA
jgi:PAS domain-containing protein